MVVSCFACFVSCLDQVSLVIALITHIRALLWCHLSSQTAGRVFVLESGLLLSAYDLDLEMPDSLTTSRPPHLWPSGRAAVSSRTAITSAQRPFSQFNCCPRPSSAQLPIDLLAFCTCVYSRTHTHSFGDLFQIKLSGTSEPFWNHVLSFVKTFLSRSFNQLRTICAK